MLQGQTASVMFFTDGLSKLGSSPTRMAEILGCGLPVVANDGVGDVARIIREYRVGVLAEGPEPEAMAAAWSELTAPRKIPNSLALPQGRGRGLFAGKRHGGLCRLYEQVLEGERRCAA